MHGQTRRTRYQKGGDTSHDGGYQVGYKIYDLPNHLWTDCIHMYTYDIPGTKVKINHMGAYKEYLHTRRKYILHEKRNLKIKT